jgi:TetR/AcrR family transcriptional repressor of nem operon
MAARRQGPEADTHSQILDVAERLVQSRGFNAFSYANVAAELGITKAALHYHFAGKAELGEALITRYAARFANALGAIDARCAHAHDKLVAYADLYANVLAEKRMCLCGMLAADYQTLPSAMRDAVIRFFDDNETWLISVLDQGQRDATLALSGSARDSARMITGALEGAMLVARPYGDVTRFEATAKRLIDVFANPARTEDPLARAEGVAPVS